MYRWVLPRCSNNSTITSLSEPTGQRPDKSRAEAADGLLRGQLTLEETLAWSCDLLTPEERLLFARLSVFAGGFSGEAVEAICSADPLTVDDVGLS